MNKVKRIVSMYILACMLLLSICVKPNAAETKVRGVVNITICNALGQVVKADVLNEARPAAIYNMSKGQKITANIYGPGTINARGKNTVSTLQDLNNDPNGEWGTTYEAATDNVEINIGYDVKTNLMVMVVKESAAAARNGLAVRDAVVYAKLMELKAMYPDGTPWTMRNTYKTINRGRINSGIVGGCQAFGYFAQDYAFGKGTKIKGRATGLEQWVNKNLLAKYGSWSYGAKFYSETGTVGAVEVAGYDGTDPVVNGNFEKIYANLRVGDLVQSVTHMGIVLSKTDTEITIAEGNFNRGIHWGRRITKESLRRALIRVESAY